MEPDKSMRGCRKSPWEIVGKQRKNWTLSTFVPPNINLITRNWSNWQAITGLAIGNGSSSCSKGRVGQPFRWMSLEALSESWWLLFLLISSHVPDPSGIEKGLERRKDLRGGHIPASLLFLRGRKHRWNFASCFGSKGTYTRVNRKTRPARWYPIGEPFNLGGERSCETMLDDFVNWQAKSWKREELN